MNNLGIQNRRCRGQIPPTNLVQKNLNDCFERDPFTQSYASFTHSCGMTTEPNEAFIFNQAGPTTNDIKLASPNTIGVSYAGTYYVSYRVGSVVEGSMQAGKISNNRVSLYVNCVQQPNSQSGFLLERGTVNICHMINGDAIINIPRGGLLSLVNDSNCGDGEAIITCNEVGNPVYISIHRIA
ncbi:MAG: hypothetical protein ACRC41_16740 [Sarcina sp.]